MITVSSTVSNYSKTMNGCFKKRGKKIERKKEKKIACVLCWISVNGDVCAPGSVTDDGDCSFFHSFLSWKFSFFSLNPQKSISSQYQKNHPSLSSKHSSWKQVILKHCCLFETRTIFKNSTTTTKNRLTNQWGQRLVYGVGRWMRERKLAKESERK